MVICKDAIHLPTGETFVSPFLLVYGTLRLGQGNYRRYLLEASHLGTFELPGWILSGITSGHTGNPDHRIVVDAFNLGKTPDGLIKSPLEIYELNWHLDSLEGVLRGGYTTSLIQSDNTPTETPATFKLYNGNIAADTNPKKLIRDHVSPKHYKPYKLLNIIPWV